MPKQLFRMLKFLENINLGFCDPIACFIDNPPLSIHFHSSSSVPELFAILELRFNHPFSFIVK